MGKQTVPIIALTVTIALSAVGVASAEKPVVVEAAPNLPPLTLDGGVTPKKLPKNASAPAVLDVSARIHAEDGTQLRELVLELDRNVTIDVRGLPLCMPGGRDIRTNHLPESCRETLAGGGSMTVSLAFPEQPAIPSKSKSFVVNGGQEGATTTLYVLNYLTEPITTGIVTTVEITRERRGRFGTRAIASIPVIAGGAGSITDFHLVLSRNLRVEGEPFSILSAQCPDGRLSARATAVFSDATEAEAEVTRPCTGKRRRTLSRNGVG
jgi:hypothetical protein